MREGGGRGEEGGAMVGRRGGREGGRGARERGGLLNSRSRLVSSEQPDFDWVLRYIRLYKRCKKKSLLGIIFLPSLLFLFAFSISAVLLVSLIFFFGVLRVTT